MRYLARPPGPALAPFVAQLWLFEGNLPDARERIVPSGEMQLLINLDADELRTYHERGVETLGGAAVCGAHDRWFTIDTREQRWIAGVAFRPGGVRPFVRASADAFTGLHVELAEVWGRDGATLRERLLEAPTAAARLDVLERVLIARAVRPLAPEPGLVRALAALDDGVAVAAVADAVGTTARTLHRAVTAATGLSPKRFARVRRFQRVLAAVERAPIADWAGLAAACGYFDQAHLIHDFRALAGICPTAYRIRAAGGHNHAEL